MAVYTEVSDDDLASFLSRYEVGELLSYKGIAEGVENTNYIVHTTTGPYILTLYEKRVSADDLPFFLGLMEHLAARQVTCPTPVRDRTGNHLGELCGRAAALVTFLEGFWIRRPKPEHCSKVGHALAQLHQAGADFKLTRRNALSTWDWRPLFERFASEADSIAPGLEALIKAELDVLETDWPLALPEGVIHADLFPDNVFFLAKDVSGLIDFYFACNDALAYDIAICLNAWCFEQDFSFNVTKARALLRGYEEIRSLTEDERKAMPLLARGAALRFLLTRCYDWLNRPAGAVVNPHDPIDYLRRLRFHQSVRSIADYGYGDGSR
ncbi:homoserine kinase [Filomicrobium sp.]|uniref:homoserine kinase n=1 Tax=Filomicrobium sp. TaxID=2024831 RepID=UPI0025880D8B|nr:homoserine kinase [Filomicrobium sp.]MCV0369141.1 homoserine kinase [Filomicrobium sp.]